MSEETTTSKKTSKRKPFRWPKWLRKVTSSGSVRRVVLQVADALEDGRLSASEAEEIASQAAREGVRAVVAARRKAQGD